jgi:hypothetical protein
MNTDQNEHKSRMNWEVLYVSSTSDSLSSCYESQFKVTESLKNPW